MNGTKNPNTAYLQDTPEALYCGAMVGSQAKAFSRFLFTTPQTSDGRWPNRLSDTIQWLDHGLDVSERCIIVIAILTMAAVSVVNVSLRNLTGTSLLFANDVTQLLLVVVTFMGLGLGARQARHIRVSAIHDLLPDKGRKVLLIIVSFFTTALLLALAVWALDYAESTQRSCRILPETFELFGITLPLTSLPAAWSLALVVLIMALGGHVITGLGATWRRLKQALPDWAGWAVILGSMLCLIAIGNWLAQAAAELVINRSGSCRVMPSTGLPIYLIHLIVPLGLVLAALQFSLAGLRNLISPTNYLSWHQRDVYAGRREDADG